MPRHPTINGTVRRIATAWRARPIGAIALALATTGVLPPPALPMDGAILVVSAADGPMPARELEPKIREALAKAGVRFSPDEIASLSNQASRALADSGGAFDRKICASGQSPCITLVRE